MKIFKKLKKKLGVLAILGLLFQTAMPIYQNIAFAQEQESIEQEQVNENADVHKDADPTVEPTGQGDSEVPVNEAEESEEKDSEAAENTEKEKSDSDLAAEEKKKIKSTEIKAEKAEAAPTADPVDLGNIFTFDSLTKNEEEIVNGAVVDVSDGDSIELKYSWNTEGMDVKSGDFAETDIPDAFKFTRDMDGDVTLSSGEKVGTFTIIDNKLRFEFDEGKETHGQVSNGTFTFRADFNLEKFEKDVVEEIIFEGKEDKSLTVIGKPSKEIKSINKEGIPDADKDAKEITWTVDIANPSEEAITNASFTDVIPEGLELNENSIKVNDLTVGLDGKLTQGDNFTVNPAIDGQNLDIPFDKIDPYKGYRVEYTTTITDNSITQFTNEANLVDGETKLPAKSTVNIERSDYVEKYGSELDNGNVEWTIDVNKAGGSIDEAIIEDDLPAGLNIESIEIFNLIQDGDNWNESESDKDADKFPINLGKITSDDAYRIKVESSIDYSKVNDGNYEQATKFINEATLKDGETELDKDDASVNIVRAAILSKKGSDVEIDHDEGKKLDWKVTVNEANHKIDNAVVTDTLPAGLTIDKSDIVVKKGDEGVTDNVTITVPDNDGENPTEVTINLGEITEEYTITYSTKVTDFSKDDFTNDATLGGTGIGPGDSTDSDKTEVKGNYYNKKSTARDADKQIISWENEVNPYREAITELVITDTFPKKGLFLLEDSVKIKIGDDELEETDFTLSSDSSYKEGFKIEFDDSVFPIEEKMKIKYDTSYNLKDVDPNEANNKNIYYNEVNFTGKTVNDTEIDEDREDTVKVGETTVNSGKKLGKLVSLDEDGNQVDGWHSGNERKLEWEVYTNYLEQDLGEDITVEDVLGYNGEVDIDNLEVKKYTVNKKGETTLGDAIDASEYDAEATDDGFTLNFNEAVSERYAIVFTTNVPEISKGVYENTATTKVGDEEYPYTGSIDFDKSEKNLSKKAIGIEGNEVFTDDEINWEIKINEDLSIIQEDVKVVDTISAGMEYKNDSLEIFKLEGTDEVKVDSSAYDLDVRHKDDGKTELRVDFKDTISSTYVLKYTTVVTETDGEVNNEVNFTGKNFKTTSVESEKLSAEQFSSTSGDKTRGKIVVEKVDNNDENIKLSGAGFKLHYLFNDEKRYIETEDGEDIHYTDNNGILEFLGLQTKRTYFLEEISAPEGYEILNDEVIEIDDLEALSVTPKGHIETIGNGKLIEVSGNKTWKDENKDQRPDSITVELSADGEFIDDQEISPDEEGNWNYKFTGLAKYDAEGNEINYTIEELDVEGYEATVTGHNIENVREAKTSVAGHKIWKDEEPTDRPDSIEVSLTREVKGEADNDFSKTQTVKPDNQGNWVYEFAELDEFDENGVAYTYIIEEDTVPKGYESSVEGHDITNVRIGETEVEGTKRWKDDKVDDRPNSVTVNLLRNNVVIDSKDITAADNWKYKFTELDKYDEDGQYYEYKVKEEQVPGYAPEITGNDITNTRSEKTSIDITKGWLDDDSKDRPESVLVHVYQNDKLFDTVNVKASNDWEYELTNLEAYDEEGQPYKYTIAEKEIEGYETTIDGFNITNLRVGETEVSGTKLWKDADDSDRPESITVNLLQNGENIASKEVTAADNWEYSFEELDKYDNQGVLYGYTIDEEPVEGYKKSGDGIDLTNTRTGITEVTGEKIWQDDNNATGARPDSITVKLLQNKTLFAQKEVTAADDWKYSFDHLPAYDDEGQPYHYTVDEETVKGYQKLTNGTDLINTRTGETAVNLDKNWKDENESDRPDSITVNLLQNGTVIASDEVRADREGKWTHTFKQLPRFDGKGKEYNYTLTEQDVPGYDSQVDGFNITNTRSAEKSIEITKSWLDDNADERPDSIKVELFRSISDGEKEPVETYEVKASNNWSLEVNNLPAFDSNGKAYAYEIEEETIEGYESEVNGFDITNLRIGQTEVHVSKVWENDTEKDRPDSIQIDLVRNGEIIQTVELSTENNWTYHFKDLEEFDSEGNAYEYSVSEEIVEGYKMSIEKNKNNFEITNTYDESTLSEAPKDKDESDDLPQTGEANNTLIYLIGSLFILVGLGIGRKRLRD